MIEQMIEKEAYLETSFSTSNLPKPVLIIDDDKIIQNRLKKLLIDINYKNSYLILSDTLDKSIIATKSQNIAFARAIMLYDRSTFTQYL